MGTGFWITPNHVITCGHILDGFAPGAPLSGQQIEQMQFKELRFSLVMDFRPNMDIAILKCENYYTKEIIPLASTSELGDSLYGYAFQPQEIYGRQFLLRYTGHSIFQNGANMMVLDGKIYPGFSGAPLFNPITQAICGIIWGITQNGLEVYAISVSSFEKYIRDVIPGYQTVGIQPKAAHQFLVQEISNVNFRETAEKIREKIGADELEEAINHLKKLPIHQSIRNDIFLADAKFSAYEKDKDNGLRPHESLEISKNNVIQALLRIADIVEQQ